MPPPDARPFDQVYRIVRRIPRGRVVTYGQISEKLDGRISPLAVGWALAQCPDDDVPWQRVVNARGGCSTRNRPELPPDYQQSILEEEGVRFRRDGTLDLEQYAWKRIGAKPRKKR